MFRYAVFIVVVLVVFITAVIFASINTDPITLNLAFTSIEIKQSLALMSFLAAGWLFGIACAGLLLLKVMIERRQLKKSLRLAEAEVSSLRSMPMQDAH
jgi:putative membrane protein